MLGEMWGGGQYLVEWLLSSALAHEGQVHSNAITSQFHDAISQPLDQLVASFSVQAVYVAAIALGFLIFVAMIMRSPSETAKRVVFWSIAGIIAITTGTLIGLTVYLNQVSVTKGPVHWHADFEIWACGEQQDLKDPQGISNKIGTPTLHEHNDNRIHVEGVVVEYRDVNLGSFFRVIGGELTDRSLTIPTNVGAKSFISGQDCAGQTSELQVFAYTADLQAKTYRQQKLTDPANFRYTDNASVPPGDCLIFEFDVPKDRTTKLCQSYEVAKVTGKLLKEVPTEEADGN